MSTCACGCGAEVREGRRYLVGHSRRLSPERAIARFWERVTKLSDDGCWELAGGTSGKGYAEVRAGDGRRVLGHRFAYELLRGPIPEGLQIDHLCRNKRCVNPDHLEVVTPAENLRRAVPFRPKKTHCPRGHSYEEHGFVASDGYVTCRTCKRVSDRRAWARYRERQAA